MVVILEVMKLKKINDMNVFVLCTGRCGSTTFSKACNYINNYTFGHETKAGLIGNNRILYNSDHIEVDNRLSWFLGKLDSYYGNNAFYVHLQRNLNATANSFVNRYNIGIIRAYRERILLDVDRNIKPFSIAIDYCTTVNTNIELFLKDKVNKMKFELENYKKDFPIFWKAIKAEGDLQKALDEFTIKYNMSNKK